MKEIKQHDIGTEEFSLPYKQCW